MGVDNHLYVQAFEAASMGMMLTNGKGTIIAVNDAFSRTTGYSKEEALGKTPKILHSGVHDELFYKNMWNCIRSTGFWQGEIWNRRKSGELFPEWLSISAVRDGSQSVTNYFGIFTDITQRKAIEDRLASLAYYDALTGLPNRTYFEERLASAVSEAKALRAGLAVLYMDLDLFKPINDSFGHSVGDRLLEEVAERLNRAVRENGFISRRGGDEFTVLLERLTDGRQAEEAAKRIAAEIEKPIVVEGREVRITCSIGISLFPEDGRHAEDLIEKADRAMYRAKELGDSFQFFS